MRLLLMLLQLLCVAAVPQMPQFEDAILGKLVVSMEKFPFLTPERSLEMVHVYPTDQQLALIKKAAAGGEQPLLRSSGKGNVRLLAGQTLKAGGEWMDYIELAIKWFANDQQSLGEFLQLEFSFEINSTVVDRSDLPFDKVNPDSYFKAMIVKPGRFESYLEDVFNPYMRYLAANDKPWLPADKIIHEMKACLYYDQGRVMDADLQYDKKTGGLMVEYKVICKEVQGSYYIGLSLYGNKFTLKDIEHIDKTKADIRVLGIPIHWTGIRRWFEKPAITASELKLLRDYIMADVGQRMQIEYSQYIEAANVEKNMPNGLTFGIIGVLIGIVSSALIAGIAGIWRCRCRNKGQLGRDEFTLLSNDSEEEM